MAELVGWLAAALTLVTFSMRSMAALRMAAIGANLCFIAYGFMSGLAPVLFLHLLLLPCNVLRLAQLPRTEVDDPARRAHSPVAEHLYSVGPVVRRANGRSRHMACAVGFTLTAAILLVPFSAVGDLPMGKAPETRGGVRVLLQAARCSEDLLGCRDLEIWVPDFQAMEGCRNFLRGFWAHAALVGTTRGDRFLLRCRYDPSIARPPGGG